MVSGYNCTAPYLKNGTVCHGPENYGDIVENIREM